NQLRTETKPEKPLAANSRVGHDVLVTGYGDRIGQGLPVVGATQIGVELKRVRRAGRGPKQRETFAAHPGNAEPRRPCSIDEGRRCLRSSVGETIESSNRATQKVPSPGHPSRYSVGPRGIRRVARRDSVDF